MKHFESSTEELRRLLSQLCDDCGNLTVQERIEVLLQNQPQLVAEYASFMATEAVLQTSCGNAVLGECASTAPAQGWAADRQRSQPAKPPVSARRLREGPSLFVWTRFQRRWVTYAVSALLLIAVGAWLAPWPTAKLTASDDAVWKDGLFLEVGGSLGRDWHELDQGRVKLAFPSGAQVAIHGPARFRAISSNSSELDFGTLTAQVPQAATGFVVDTNRVKIVDLGTAFRVHAEPDGKLECHVTDGRVELRRLDQPERVTLRAGMIGILDGDAESVEVREETLTGLSPSVIFSSEHPTSLRYKAFIHDDRIFAFLESYRLRLTDDLRLNVVRPGRHDQLHEVQGVVPRGKVVSCYLIHSAPASRRHIAQGQIRFPRPIIGIICDSDRLNATNGILGAGWTLQCEHNERGLESAPNFNSDELILSADRRTLTLRLRTESIDQLRVLVAED